MLTEAVAAPDTHRMMTTEKQDLRAGPVFSCKSQNKKALLGSSLSRHRTALANAAVPPAYQAWGLLCTEHTCSFLGVHTGISLKNGETVAHRGGEREGYPGEEGVVQDHVSQDQGRKPLGVLRVSQ